MVPRLLLLSSLLFGGLAYVFLWVQTARGMALPAAATLWLIALICYAVLFGILLLLHQFSDVVLPEFPQLLTEWSERVGIAHFEPWGIGAAGAAALACLIYVPPLLPIPILCGLGFLAMLLVPAQPVLPEETRSLYHPPHVSEDQTSTPLPLDAPKPEQLPEGVAVREYSWQVEWAPHEGASQQMWVPIVLARLQRFRENNPYRQEPPPQVVDFQEFVSNSITGEVLHTAHYFQQETKRRVWTPFHEICNVLAFVQSIPYSLDADSVQRLEYFRYPIETLADHTGDCEDTSILAASLLKTLQHEVVMLLIPPSDGEAGHVAVGVAAHGFPDKERLAQHRYLYCETTTQGWHVGEVPDQYRGREIQVRPV